MHKRAYAFVWGAVLITGMACALKLGSGGATYPRFSSLRSGPGGLKLLFDTLTLDGTSMDIQRNFIPLEDWSDLSPSTGGTTWILAGVQPYGWLEDEANLRILECLAAAGNRVIVGLDSAGRLQPFGSQRKNVLQKAWDVSIDARGREPRSDTDAGSAFSLVGGRPWRVLLKDDARPVVIERRFASGSVVLAGSSGALLNERFARDREIESILELLGPNRRLIFDETHLGMEERGSIAGLARRFHLLGFLLGLLALAALFVWRNVTSFPPARASAGPQAVAGRDALTGLAILLERNLDGRSLTAACIAERKRFDHRFVVARAPANEESALLRSNDAVAAFRAAQNLSDGRSNA